MKVGIIGCGNMGSALARGILSKRIFPFKNIYVSDKDPLKTKELYKKFGINVATNHTIAENCNCIIIAVKPQDSEELLSFLSGALTRDQAVISIMAGIPISVLEKRLKKIPITRAMPNMAAIVGKSITCLCHNKYVIDRRTPYSVFSSVGEVLEVNEKMLDIVTAVSGSGPAYFFYLTETLRDAAIKLGMNKNDALKLAIATLIGSASLVRDTHDLPETLRMRITSRKGTTEAALKVFKSRKFDSIVKEAVRAAYKRSKELSKKG